MSAQVYDWAEAWARTAPQTPPPAPIQPFGADQAGTLSAYATAALAGEAAKVRLATQGVRNDTLNAATFSLAQLVAAGHLGYQQVHDELLDAARACGLPDWEAERTIGSGFRGGRNHPRQVVLTGGAATQPDVQEVDHLGPAAAGDQDDQDAQGDERRRTSWWARPLAVRADADADEAEPTILVRDDGRALLYPGKINGLIGESESGKSWLALHAAHQHAAGGGHVLILDFEDTPATTRRRLVALGCTPEALSRIDYANPDQALDALAAGDLTDSLDGPTLILLDGVNAAMTLLGLDLNSNTDATLFHTRLLKPLTARGAGVLTVDHVPKNAEQRGKGGIGAQAKRAMMSGCAIRVEVSEPFGKGKDGKVKLYVDKDRPGHVRGISSNGKYAGTFTLTGRGDQLVAEVRAPEISVEDWRPTVMMGRISRLLQAGPMSKNAIENTIDGRAETIREALRHLVEDGYVAREQGSRGALLHRSIKAFEESVSEVDPHEL